jgi:hypothetical protein
MEVCIMRYDVALNNVYEHRHVLIFFFFFFSETNEVGWVW